MYTLKFIDDVPCHGNMPHDTLTDYLLYFTADSDFCGVLVSTYDVIKNINMEIMPQIFI